MSVRSFLQEHIQRAVEGHSYKPIEIRFYEAFLQGNVEKGLQKQACWTMQRSVCKVIITRMHREGRARVCMCVCGGGGHS